MIDPKRTYRTRDGREVRIYAVDGGGLWPVHGAYKADEYWQTCTWRADGGSTGSVLTATLDLIEVRPRIKREVWVNVYPSDRRYGCHSSRIGADEGGTADRIACVKLVIDCEEGHGCE